MPKTETIRARVEPELKHDAETVFATLGLTPTQAVTLFYKQVTLTQGLPFPVTIPNKQTRNAMRHALEDDELTEWPSVDALKSAHG